MLLHELIAELARQGKTIMYISHVLEVTEKVCARVIMLYQGKIVADDEVGRLRDLMHLPSLEQIFRQLAKQEDVGASAREIVSVIREA
jgi:ABC-2 type transport system ATP-binding protein